MIPIEIMIISKKRVLKPFLVLVPTLCFSSQSLVKELPQCFSTLALLTFGMDEFLCTKGRLAASLASTH